MQVRLFGGIELTASDGAPLRLPTRQTKLVLAALALAGPKGLRRSKLCELFWPDRGEAQARNSLRQGLAALRRLCKERSLPLDIEADLETALLEGPASEVDVWRFDALLSEHSTASLTAAADLYRAPLLADEPLGDTAEPWFAAFRQGYERKAIQLADTLSRSSELDRVGEACAALVERLLFADPAAEEAHRALIRLHQRRGNLNAARRQFELCKEVLARELNVAPEAATRELLDREAPPQPNLAMPPPASRPHGEIGRNRSERPSIVVMPFDNLSGEADEYFADGVVEEVTAALSRVRDFFVIARQSAFTYKGRFVDVQEIGRDLGVDYAVEGTVRRGGDRLRISVQLVDTGSRTQLWSERYEGVSTDIFEFQDRIAAQVAGAIHPAVRNAEIALAKRKPPESLQAHDFVLRAYPQIWGQSRAENDGAIANLERAIAADPRYGRAHALLAWCHSQAVVYLWTDDPERERAAAAAAVERAAALLSDDPTGLAAIGSAISQCLTDLVRAEAYIESALALDPNNAWAWARLGWVALYRDQPAAAQTRFERSLTLNPLDPLASNLRVGIAMAHAFQDEYERSAGILRDVLQVQPGVTWAYRQLAFVLAMIGDLDGARAAIAKLRAAHPNATIAMMRICHPGRHAPRTFEKMIESWRLAGLPEA